MSISPLRPLIVALVTVLAVLPMRASAAEPKAGAAATAPALATRTARFPAFRTATADFTQEREVSLVDETLHAAGKLALAAPAAFRLDLTTPEPFSLIAEGAQVVVVDAQGKTLPLPPEVAGLAAFARTLTDLLIGARAPAGFTETWRDADTVVLVPQSDAASPFTEITLHFPSDGPLPETIAMRERGGDRTTIRLRAIVLNPALDPARFRAPAAKGP